jgi:ketosteroid isomerase-like protein
MVMGTVDRQDTAAVIERLCRATNNHDLDAIVACFSPDYRNETPAHPARGFTGRQQVRRNWTQILAAVPDLTAEVLRCSVDGDTVWTEWVHRGTRPDGSPHHLCGVMIVGVGDDTIAWTRFYLEPVDQNETMADEAVRAQVGAR